MHQIHQRILPIALLIAIGLLIYSNSLQVPTYLDDSLHITDNNHIKLSVLSVDEILGAAFDSPDPHRPVANISFALNYYLDGGSLKGLHLTNTFIHIGTGILLFWFTALTLRILGTGINRSLIRYIAFCVALLWLVNPVNVQSVTYLIQRMNSLSVFFYMMSFVLYIKARLASIVYIRWCLFAGSVIAGVLALGTKEIAFTLPFFILLYEWYFFQNLEQRWLIQRLPSISIVLLLMLLLVFAYFNFNPDFLDGITAGYISRDFSLTERILTEWRVVIFYISLLFYPHPSRLSLEHDFPLSSSLIDPLTTILSLCFILVSVILAIWLARKERLLSFGIIWFLGQLVIESTFLPLEIIFEHRLYLPSIGLILPAVMLSYRQMSTYWATAGFCLLALAWGSWTYERNSVWSDKVTFHEDAVIKSPQNIRANVNLGAAYLLAGRMDDAYISYSNAIRIASEQQTAVNEKSGDLSLKEKMPAKAYLNRGSIHKAKGMHKQAIEDYSMAIKILPELKGPHVNRGNIYLQIGRNELAVSDYTDAIRLDPDNAAIYYNRSLALHAIGNLQAALNDLDHAIQLEPGLKDAHIRRNVIRNKITDLN